MLVQTKRLSLEEISMVFGDPVAVRLDGLEKIEVDQLEKEIQKLSPHTAEVA